MTRVCSGSLSFALSLQGIMMRFFFLSVFFSLSLWGSGAEAGPSTPPIDHTSLKEAEIATFELANGLRVLLISDPSHDVSAAALSVKAGSWDDPKQHPGLAHFLEHMIFMGTEKYPEEADFSGFVKRYGGKTNAFTEDQYTTYLFEIDTDGFRGALNRFAEFFKTPLFRTGSMEREIQAVEQEFASHKQQDDSRRIMVFKSLGHPDHPFSRFNFGNRASLSQTTTEDLKTFFETHYSADKMTLVVLSPLSLSTLKTIVQEDFSDLAHDRSKSTPPEGPLFPESLLGHILYVDPIQDESKMMMIWEVPKSFAAAFDERPDEVICHVLGHEGKESLLENLKREGLALNLGCGGMKWSFDAMAFVLDIGLTPKGARHPDRVGQRVFEAIAALKKSPYPEYLFEEIQTSGKLKLKYPEKEGPFEEATKHSRNLRYEDLSTYPEKTKVIQKYDPRLVRKFLDYLTPSQVIIDVTAKSSLTGVRPDQTETWMGTRFAVRKIPDDVLKKWKRATLNPRITLPPPNPMIPRNLKMIDRSGDQVITIQDDRFGKVIWAPDTHFNVPKISWTLRLLTPVVDAGNPKSNVLTDIWIETVKQQLNPFAYLSKLGGLKSDISQITNGVELTINGFSEHASQFLERVLKIMKNPQLEEKRFDLIKKALLDKYNKIETAQPYLQAIDLFKDVLYDRYSTERDKVKALDTVTFEDFQRFARSFFKETVYEALFYGNLTKHEAVTASQILRTTQEAPYTQVREKKVAVFPGDKGPFYLEKSKDGAGSALLVAVEDPDFSFRSLAMQKILSTLISGPFFDELRTKQQTAYLIANLQEEVEGKFFSLFLLQSFSYAPKDLLARVELFLEFFPKMLDKAQFESAQRALVKELRRPFESVKKEGEELAKLAFDKGGDFNWRQRTAEAAEAIAFDDFVSYVNAFLGKHNRRRFAVLLKGKGPQELFEYHKAPSLEWVKEQSEYKLKRFPQHDASSKTE